MKLDTVISILRNKHISPETYGMNDFFTEGGFAYFIDDGNYVLKTLDSKFKTWEKEVLEVDEARFVTRWLEDVYSVLCVRKIYDDVDRQRMICNVFYKLLKISKSSHLWIYKGWHIGKQTDGETWEGWLKAFNERTGDTYTLFDIWQEDDIDVDIIKSNCVYTMMEQIDERSQQDKELYLKALTFASEKHKMQERRDGSPYIYHPMKVAELVKEAGYGLKYQITALLHDVLEDTDATEDEVREFGESVLEAVKLLTRPEKTEEIDYVEGILENKIATVVKNSDKMHNLWDSMFSDDKRWSRKYLKKAQKYYKGKFSEALDNIIKTVEEMENEEYIERCSLPWTKETIIKYPKRAEE